MSEPLPPREPERRGLKGTLTRKLGPLPTWTWVLIVVAIILGWAFYRSRTGSQQQQGPSDTVGAGQVPQFVNQTFTNVGPPPAADQDGDEDNDQDDIPRPIMPHSHPVGRLPGPNQRPHPGKVPPRAGPPGQGGPPSHLPPPTRHRRRRHRRRMTV